MRADFKTGKPTSTPSDEWYDMDYDRVLIEQSLAKQYGVLPSAQDDLRYSDWAKMVSGLMDDTPLGRVVSTRMEQDKDILQHFTPEQRRIRSEWQQFRAQKQARQMQAPENRAAWERQMADLEHMLAGLVGR